jgi:hypothetical protein
VVSLAELFVDQYTEDPSSCHAFSNFVLLKVFSSRTTRRLLQLAAEKSVTENVESTDVSASAELLMTQEHEQQSYSQLI